MILKIITKNKDYEGKYLIIVLLIKFIARFDEIKEFPIYKSSASKAKKCNHSVIFKLKDGWETKCQPVSDRITEKQKFALTSECCEQKMSSWWRRNLCLHSERVSELSKGDISSRITQLLQGQLNRLCSFNRSQLLFTVLVKKWQLSEWLTLY